MELKNVWGSFLKKLEDQMGPMTYDTWFKDTKLKSLEGNVATIIVPMIIHKKHLKDNYYNIISDTFTEITGSNYDFSFLTEEEIESNVEVSIEKGVPKALFIDSNLNPKYTFDSFVVGESNKFARTTSLAVAEKPGFMYNPLFIYGNSGLGKTHLMHAIGNYIVENSNKKVLYVTSEQFINDFVGINKRKKDDNNFDSIELFKSKYRDIDVLMIDDIQYLGNATQTQQEFFNTFNYLYNNNKQIIISSDRFPDDLKLLEDRLRTRFNWGLTINILPPDFQLRLDIIENKIKSDLQGSEYPQDVKEFIAGNCVSNIRKLEGALTRVYAYSTIMGGDVITLELAQEALKDYFVDTITAKNKIDQVQQIVAAHYNISVEDLKGKRRVSKIKTPRQIAMYICREVLEETFPKIGIEFGGKDHSTVIYSVDKIKKEIESNEILRMEIEKLINEIK